MSNNDRFLELYREYETLLRDAGKEYKQVEESAEPLIQDRMRMVRQMRNYLVHSNDAGFVEASGKQTAFLERLVKEQKLSGDILKKHLKTPKAASCTMDEKLSDILRKMLKLGVDILPVSGADGYRLAGAVTMADATRAYLDAERPKTAKLSTVKKFIRTVPCAGPGTPMPEIFSAAKALPIPVICCTNTGKMDGKFLGVYFMEQ